MTEPARALVPAIMVGLRNGLSYEEALRRAEIKQAKRRRRK